MVGAERTAEHQSLLLLPGSRRDLDGEAVHAAGGMNCQRHLYQPGLASVVGRGRRGRMGAASSRNGSGSGEGYKSEGPNSRNSTAVRPFPLDAIRASSCWPG